jgi:hypothetical protein
MPNDIARIAAGLDDSQKTVLLMMARDGYSYPVMTAAAQPFIDAGLFNGPGRRVYGRNDQTPEWILTPLGLAVRNHLKGSSHD